jgi:acyl-CoA thioesterase I
MQELKCTAEAPRALRWIFYLLSVVCVLMLGCGRANDGGDTANPKTGKFQKAAEPTTEEAADTRPVIVAFGDSLTAGLGVHEAENYPAKLQKKLDDAGYKYRVINAGVSGDTSSQGLNRLSAILSLHAKIVILELGANDGLRGIPVEETKRNLESIVRSLKESGAKVLLAGMKMPPNYGSLYGRAFERIFTDLAKQDGVGLIPFFLDGVGGRANLNQDDGIHPTAKGYDTVTENVWRALKPVLDQLGALFLFGAQLRQFIHKDLSIFRNRVGPMEQDAPRQNIFSVERMIGVVVRSEGAAFYGQSREYATAS